jgi:hypothetical protein
MTATRVGGQPRGQRHAPEVPLGMAVIRGAFIAESLRPGTVLEGNGLILVRCSRYEVRDVPAYQPPRWTLVEFEAPESVGDSLAEKLAAALLEPGWYASWNSDTESTVVYPGRVFRYPRFDQDGRDAATAFGREMGVPEPQLDWGA